MSDLVSTGGGHHHSAGCTCPFCLSTTHTEPDLALDENGFTTFRYDASAFVALNESAAALDAYRNRIAAMEIVTGAEEYLISDDIDVDRLRYIRADNDGLGGVALTAFDSDGNEISGVGLGYVDWRTPDEFKVDPSVGACDLTGGVDLASHDHPASMMDVAKVRAHDFNEDAKRTQAALVVSNVNEMRRRGDG